MSSRTRSERPSAADRWGLWVATFLAACAALVLAAGLARAQARPDVPELQLAPCPGLDGVDAEGQVVHFPRATADCMLGRLRLLPRLVEYVGSLEERVRRDDARVELRDREIELMARQVEAAVGNLEAALRRAREAEEDRDRWFRHPVFLMGMGALVVVALEVVAIVLFAELSP